MSPGSGLAYPYEDVAQACRKGIYPSSVIRAASGRVNYLFGVTPKRLKLLRRKAREYGVGLIVLGSRVSGPRLRQRTLHPALEATLPLKTARRSPSAVFGGVDGIDIDKTVIKDYGPDDAHTSDLSIVLVDPYRSQEQMRELAVKLEIYFKAQSWGFPLRFFAELSGSYLRNEDDFLRDGETYLRSLLPANRDFSPRELREAMEELYLAINLRRSALSIADARNGAVTALLFAGAFSLGLGFHWALLPIGFFFGLVGRYLARLRAGIAFSLGDGVLGNAAALGFDALFGASIMAYLINPATGLAIPLQTIAAGSLLHSLSKGSMRLFLEKIFSVGNERAQSRGVLIVGFVNFALSGVTSFVYAGSSLAVTIQYAVCVLGLTLLFVPVIARRD